MDKCQRFIKYRTRKNILCVWKSLLTSDFNQEVVDVNVKKLKTIATPSLLLYVDNENHTDQASTSRESVMKLSQVTQLVIQ